jgi:PEP-CTERM motif
MILKTRAVRLILGLTLLASASASADAATMFDFSYAFHDNSGALTGDTITGSFFGVRAGNDVTSISNANASFDGTALTGPLFVYSYTPTSPNCGTADCYTLGGATVSFNGLDNNFLFIDSPPSPSDHLTSATNYFYIIQPWANGGPGSSTIATQFSSPTSLVEQYNGDYFASSFTLSAVPEPTTWALLFLGFGAIGCALRARRRDAAAVA